MNPRKRNILIRVHLYLAAFIAESSVALSQDLPEATSQ